MKRKYKRKVKFGWPDYIESLLIGGIFLLLFLFDVLQNKFLDLGLDYKVNVFSGLQFTALNGFWIVVLIYHFVLMGLILRSVWDRGTHKYYDYIVGAITIVGLFLIIAGAIAGIYFDAHQAIPWLFNMAQINIYHLGISLQVFGALYFLITK